MIGYDEISRVIGILFVIGLVIRLIFYLMGGRND
jgi:hypothetical protein